jgi:hypothetical protein
MLSWRMNRAGLLATATVFGSALSAAALFATVLFATPASATAAAAHHGNEQFRISTHTVGARTDYLRAIGVIDARAHAVASAIVSGHSTVRLEFPKGSIVLRLTVGKSSVTVPNLTTCVFAETSSGTFRITTASRAYKGATGSGRFYTRIRARLAKSAGACTAKLAAYGKYQVAWGSLSW